MEIWLDTCNRQEIIDACQFGFVTGITTNPTILSKSGEDHDQIINELLEVQDGPIAIQVTAEETAEIIKRAHNLHAFSDRILVKIPVTKEGLKAIKALSADNIPTMATAIFQPNQAFLAALAGADYVAPYISRMLDRGIDAYAALDSMVTMFEQYSMKTKILAAALKTIEQITLCAEMGIEAVTLKPSLFSEFTANDEATMETVREFSENWEARERFSNSALVL